jgi:hypothetical protein
VLDDAMPITQYMWRTDTADAQLRARSSAPARSAGRAQGPVGLRWHIIAESAWLRRQRREQESVRQRPAARRGLCSAVSDALEACKASRARRHRHGHGHAWPARQAPRSAANTLSRTANATLVVLGPRGASQRARCSTLARPGAMGRQDWAAGWGVKRGAHWHGRSLGARWALARAIRSLVVDGTCPRGCAPGLPGLPGPRCLLE